MFRFLPVFFLIFGSISAPELGGKKKTGLYVIPQNRIFGARKTLRSKDSSTIVPTRHFKGDPRKKTGRIYAGVVITQKSGASRTSPNCGTFEGRRGIFQIFFFVRVRKPANEVIRYSESHSPSDTGGHRFSRLWNTRKYSCSYRICRQIMFIRHRTRLFSTIFFRLDIAPACASSAGYNL